MRIGIGRGASMVAAAALVGSAVNAQAPMTVQQQFDAATALTAGSDKTAALAAWTAFEHRIANNPRTLAVVRIRKAAVLLALDRMDEAAADARVGLAALPPKDASLAEDRFTAQFLLGRIAQDAIDYASAAANYRTAEDIAPDAGGKVAAALGVVETDIFVDPPAAQAALGRIDALLATHGADKVVRGRIAKARGLLALNEGQFADARKQSIAAVELFGGLTEKTDLDDVTARSDTALASMLAGDAETARKYMAYTGAGRIPDGSFNPAVEMSPPDCGGEAGLKPADMAVVQFSIADDGSVVGARPIYAAGGGAVALEFARAAQRWSWTPEQVKALPRFFRFDARVEMRCSTGFARPSIGNAMDAAVSQWLSDKGVGLPLPSEGSAAAALPAQRAAFAKASGLAAIAASMPLLNNPVLPMEERHAVATGVLALADANGAPPLARLDFDLEERATAKVDGRRARTYRSELAAMLVAPPYANDPRARAAIKLSLAGNAGRHPDPQTRAWLREVADDGALAGTDAFKIAALLQIASIDQQDGDEAAARTAFDRTGLTADQCALIDSPPKLQSSSFGSDRFPMEAARWGFEGWTMVQFDIAADGRVQGQRTVISYPPFVFSKAGSDMWADARYAKTYRPAGGLGCGAATQRIRFMLPGRR